MPGICCEVPDTPVQATIHKGKLVKPFNRSAFLQAVMKWIVVSGLPFSTIENPHLQAACHTANPDADLQSTRTLVRRLGEAYDLVNERVVAELRSVASTVHFVHDSWTDAGRKNSYFGIFATYIDSNFEYKEVLIRLIKMEGQHSGKRMGDGLFYLFHNVLGIAENLGPGTGDNASNNRSAAARLENRLRTELGVETLGEEMVGCMCHIANLAALQYIKEEGKSSPLNL